MKRKKLMSKDTNTKLLFELSEKRKCPKLSLGWTELGPMAMLDSGMGWNIHEDGIEAFVVEWIRKEKIKRQNDLDQLLDLEKRLDIMGKAP